MFNNFNQEQYYKTFPNMRADLEQQYMNNYQNVNNYSRPYINQGAYRQPQVMGIQGKSVDSIEVVKAMDIPLDGSISYFPLTDGTAIVTKQLMKDGSSKVLIYKPISTEESNTIPQYVTVEEMNKAFSEFDISGLKDIKDVKDELKNLKRQLRDISDDLKDKKVE